jgi:uncharacterized protein (TIGR00369 family)
MLTETRSRTYTYAAPRPHPEAQGLSGVELLQRIARGELPPPPMAATAGIDLGRIERGKVDFEAEPAEWAENPLGTVHGGWVATILDSALGCAVHSALEPGVGYTTASLELKFVRPVLSTTGRLRAEGRVVHVGSRVAVAEGRLVGVADGKIYATATTTCLVLAGR